MYAQTTKKLFAIFLSVVLVISMGVPMAILPSVAYADKLSDARATLSQAESRLNTISTEYNAIQKEIAAIDKEIAETTKEAVKVQEQILVAQENLGDTMVASYKNIDSASIVQVFLASESLEDFMKNIDYYNAIQQDQAAQVAALSELRDKFQTALDELNTKKDEQDKMLEQAAAKKAEAEQVVSEAAAKVSSIESEQARLEALQNQANSMEKEENEPEIDSDWNTGNNNNDSNNNSSNSGNSEENNSSQAGWKTGVASAYGGSTDPWTPNPGTTATGARCDDYSMGVAVPMAWPGYRKYFNRAIEIKYNGKTVVATVNDCGYMGGGSRSLDLQPGVWKAFGFKSCQAWGLRTVSYRIL